MAFKFDFTPPTDGARVNVNLSVVPKGSLACPALTFTVGAAGKTFSCTRKGLKGITVSVDADWPRDHDIFQLPPIVKTKPPIVVRLDRTNDTMGKPGNVFDGFRSAYMERRPEVGGMWTATGGGPYHIGWIFEAPAPGRYTLRVAYASEDSRPSQVYVNDVLQLPAALSKVTQTKAQPQWFVEGTIELSEGINRLWIHREQPPPNIDAVQLVKQ